MDSQEEVLVGFLRWWKPLDQEKFTNAWLYADEGTDEENVHLADVWFFSRWVERVGGKFTDAWLFCLLLSRIEWMWTNKMIMLRMIRRNWFQAHECEIDEMVHVPLIAWWDRWIDWWYLEENLSTEENVCELWHASVVPQLDIIRFLF